MKDISHFRRGTVVVCLVLAPVLMLISNALQGPFVEGYVDRLTEVDEAGGAAWAANVLFIATMVPMLVAFLGIAHLLRDRSPKLAIAGSVLGLLATFGEAVMGGTGLVYLTMASDAPNRELFAGVWEQMESSPVMLFATVGFGGLVLTLILLSIGLFRTQIVPRWVPVLVWLFLVLEFAGTALSDHASYAAVLCLLIAFGALSRHVRQTPTSDWAVAGSRTETEVAVAA